MPKTRVYAVRDAETKERLSYRYRSIRELREKAPLRRWDHTGRIVEVYQTTQNLPRTGRGHEF